MGASALDPLHSAALVSIAVSIFGHSQETKGAALHQRCCPWWTGVPGSAHSVCSRLPHGVHLFREPLPEGLLLQALLAAQGMLFQAPQLAAEEDNKTHRRKLSVLRRPMCSSRHLGPRLGRERSLSGAAVHAGFQAPRQLGLPPILKMSLYPNAYLCVWVCHAAHVSTAVLRTPPQTTLQWTR